MKNIQEAIAWNLDTKTLDEEAKKTDYVRIDLFEQAGTDNFDVFIREKVDPVFPVGMTFEDWKKKAYELEGKTL